VKAFILAAGLGTRLQPYTTELPKALVLVQGTPMIEIVIKRLIKYGIKDITINLHHFADKIKSFIESKNNFGINITYSYEQELLDTGGAIKQARNLLLDTHPVIIHNVDILSDIDFHKMKRQFEKNNADVLLAVKQRKTSRYLLFNNQNRMVGWKNIKTGDTILLSNINTSKLNAYAFSGIHLISQDALNIIAEYPHKIFSITKFYLENMEKIKIYGFLHNSKFVMDLGKIDNLETAQYLDLKKFL